MNRLWVRLSLAFLLVAWLSVGAMALVVQRTTEAGFRQYIDQRNAAENSQQQINRLQSYYAEHGNWIGVESVFGGRGDGGGRGATFSVASLDGTIIASTDATLIGTPIPAASLSQAVELRVNGQVVGLFYRRTPGEQALGSAEVAFLYEANRTLMLTGIIVSMLAVAAGLGLSWLLVNPLKRLTRIIHDFPGGKMGQQVNVSGTLEIKALAQAFNGMSAQLAEGESLRQRMAADIAHELRTPVSVLRGHLEAMRDGVFALDQEHLAVAHDQTLYLGRLVDDLRILTLAEAKHLPLNISPIVLSNLAGEIVERFRPLAIDADIELNFSTFIPKVQIRADSQRLQQVLGNLLTNALRHTPTQGEITVTIAQVSNKARLTVRNTGSYLTAEEIQNVFRPFWRASESREHDTGGSGLGLAISKELIELHQGKMWVESTQEQVSFIFDLPIS
ncbi:MAG: ATP-binding protein [Chloroflexota bacterium]